MVSSPYLIRIEPCPEGSFKIPPNYEETFGIRAKK